MQGALCLIKLNQPLHLPILAKMWFPPKFIFNHNQFMPLKRLLLEQP
jgi:hypothetical protein